MDTRFHKENQVTKRKEKRLVHVGEFAAEIEVELLESPEGWSPYLSLEEATKLDRVREALRRGDLKTAGRFGRIYRLVPLAG